MRLFQSYVNREVGNNSYYSVVSSYLVRFLTFAQLYLVLNPEDPHGRKVFMGKEFIFISDDFRNIIFRKMKLPQINMIN